MSDTREFFKAAGEKITKAGAKAINYYTDAVNVEKMRGRAADEQRERIIEARKSRKPLVEFGKKLSEFRKNK